MLDMAACLFARRHILDSGSKWYIHLRTDSSPQGGRDYLVSEYDWCKLGASAPFVSNTHVRQLLDEGRFGIASRLLPLAIVGSRAGSAVHKGQQLLRSLGLEADDLPLAISRTRTLLFDFGAESGIWSLQATDGSLNRLFPLALPVADIDHSIHHVMQDLPVSFTNWDEFKQLLSAFSKAFGKFYLGPLS